MQNNQFGIAKVRLSKLDKIKIAFNLMKTNHSHDRENARRRRHIERGIIQITVLCLLLHPYPVHGADTAGATTTKSQSLSALENEFTNIAIPTVPVTVEVEYPGHFWDFYHDLLPAGSTTSDALGSSHRVIKGRVCLDPEGVVSVDGVKEYWMVSVNGDYQNVNAHTILKPRDSVKWQHVSAHRNADHIV